MRRLVVILIVSNLLLCPFQCKGLMSTGNDNVRPGCATCDCGACRHSQDLPTDEPVAPIREKGCDSCQCVCGGAIFGKNTPAELALAVDFFAGAPESATALTLAMLRQADAVSRQSGLPPGVSSGRELRVRFASLVC